MDVLLHEFASEEDPVFFCNFMFIPVSLANFSEALLHCFIGVRDWSQDPRDQGFARPSMFRTGPLASPESLTT